MQGFKETIVSIEKGKFTVSQLVSILILTASKLKINTISEMARLENKTPRGILISKRFKKIKIGVQKFAVGDCPEDSFPY